MKKIVLLSLIACPLFMTAQSFMIKVEGKEYRTSKIPDVSFNNEIKDIEIKIETADQKPVQYELISNGEPLPFPTDGNYKKLAFKQDIRGNGLVIKSDKQAIVGQFVLPVAEEIQEEPTDTETAAPKLLMEGDQTAREYVVNTLYQGQTIRYVENRGLIINKFEGDETSGEDYVHIFLDQNGNSLINSIPVGTSMAKYVVHVIYLVPKGNPMAIAYTAVQGDADIEEGVVIRGEGNLQNGFNLQMGEKSADIEVEWAHTETVFTPSAFDVPFDIVRTGFEVSNGNLSVARPTTVAARKIKIKKMYHGSIDVGILSTNVENPSFSLTASATDPALMVVKKSDTGSRVLASAMYTFYLSPVILLEKIFAPSTVRNYKLEGRSFADDHRLYERIYPAAGIGLSDRLLDNIFVGFKWEFIKGGSVFLGYNWSKVNTIDVPADFVFGETPMTQAAYDLKTDTKWRDGLCFGLNLDVRIIKNIFTTTGGN